MEVLSEGWDEVTVGGHIHGIGDEAMGWSQYSETLTGDEFTDGLREPFLQVWCPTQGSLRRCGQILSGGVQKPRGSPAATKTSLGFAATASLNQSETRKDREARENRKPTGIAGAVKDEVERATDLGAHMAAQQRRQSVTDAKTRPPLTTAALGRSASGPRRRPSCGSARQRHRPAAHPSRPAARVPARRRPHLGQGAAEPGARGRRGTGSSGEALALQEEARLGAAADQVHQREVRELLELLATAPREQGAEEGCSG